MSQDIETGKLQALSKPHKEKRKLTKTLEA